MHCGSPVMVSRNADRTTKGRREEVTFRLNTRGGKSIMQASPGEESKAELCCSASQVLGMGPVTTRASGQASSTASYSTYPRPQGHNTNSPQTCFPVRE